MARIFKCKCGAWFTGKAQLREHIAIYDLLTPAKSYDEMHCEVVRTK